MYMCIHGWVGQLVDNKTGCNTVECLPAECVQPLFLVITRRHISRKMFTWSPYSGYMEVDAILNQTRHRIRATIKLYTLGCITPAARMVTKRLNNAYNVLNKLRSNYKHCTTELQM